MKQSGLLLAMATFFFLAIMGCEEKASTTAGTAAAFDLEVLISARRQGKGSWQNPCERYGVTIYCTTAYTSPAKISGINLRNPKVAYIFATRRLRN